MVWLVVAGYWAVWLFLVLRDRHSPTTETCTLAELERARAEAERRYQAEVN